MRSRLITLLLMMSVVVSVVANDLPTINPTPQEVTVTGQMVEIPHHVYMIGDKTADVTAVKLLNQLFENNNDRRGFQVIVGKKGDAAIRKYNKLIPNRAEGYYLAIEKKRIVIAGADERGTFYGVKTLQQLLAHTELPELTISDYPNIAERGVVEGFYGEPWSFEDRLSHLKFYGDNKLNTYIYGPKDDPYHRSPHWREPYPAEEAQKIAELVNVARENHVNFVWAAHPGMDIKWTIEDRDAMMNKLELMYDLGVRNFAVFFDDISGEGVNAAKQAELLNYIDDNFIQPKGDNGALILCPTEYNKGWSNIERGYLPTLGEQLNDGVHIMWTGDRVISDIDVQGLEWINGHIKRNAYIWWNFPVSDYVRDHLLMGPSYGLDTAADGMMSGFMSNPMEHAEASKIGIYGVADYSWNISSYEPMRAWENAIKDLLPSNHTALRVFAHHNADLGPNGHGYRRDESWEFKEIADNYLESVEQGGSADVTQQVRNEFIQMMSASNLLFMNKENPKLRQEMLPWIIHFKLLAEVGLVTTYLQEALPNKEEFNMLFDNVKLIKQQIYEVDNTMNQNPYQPGVKTGSLVISPMIDAVLVSISNQYEALYNEQLPRLDDYSPHLIYTNIAQVSEQPVRYHRKSVTISPMLEVVRVDAEEYFGIELEPAQKVASIKINIGVEELPEWAAMEASTDGVEWKVLEGKTNNNKDWSIANPEGEIKYIRLINNSEEEQECYLKTFEVRIK